MSRPLIGWRPARPAKRHCGGKKELLRLFFFNEMMRQFFLEESAKGPPVIYGGGRYTKGLAGSGAKCHFGECALPFTRPIHQLLPATLIPLAHNHFLLDGIKRAGQPPRCAPSIFRTKKNKERKQKQSQMYLPLLD